jgi:hypothetical protein
MRTLAVSLFSSSLLLTFDLSGGWLKSEITTKARAGRRVPIHAQSHRAWVGLMPPPPGTKINSAKTSVNSRVKPFDPPKSPQPPENKREKTFPQVA